jgi:hypothetical protein
MKTVNTIYHPKTKELKCEIIGTQSGMFFFEEQGDWYDDQEICEFDALNHLKDIYGGSFKTSMELSEEKYYGYF